AFWLAVVFMLVALPSYIFSWQQKNIITSHKNAIIYNPSVTVKSSPDGQSTDIFVLHEGTRVEIRETIGEWIEIMMADGNVGWVMAGEVRLI
ncbi:MAG: SH3 domain-containing protein, partial [Bacteroidota bacterium]